MREAAAAGQRLLLALDFDGTLARIRRHHEDVLLPSRRRELLLRIDRLPRVQLLIVSGRPLKQLRGLFAGTKIPLAGDHGLDLAGMGRDWRHPSRRRLAASLAGVLSRVRPWTRGLPGVEIETKAGSASVHWRNSPTVRRQPEALHKVLESLLPRGWRVVRGKCVWDIRPDISWGKGDVILLARSRCGPTCRILVIGDDQTDEEAFRRLGHRAWMVKVGTDPSHSFWRVRGVRDVDGILRDVLRVWA